MCCQLPSVNCQLILKTMPHLSQQQVREMYAEKMTRMRRKLLALGHTMNWGLQPRTEEERRMSKSELNMKRVNAWLMSERSEVRLPMQDMTYKQLCKAVTQFELVVKDYIQKLAKA